MRDSHFTRPLAQGARHHADSPICGCTLTLWSWPPGRGAGSAAASSRPYTRAAHSSPTSSTSSDGRTTSAGLIDGGHVVVGADDEGPAMTLAAAGGLDTVINDAPGSGPLPFPVQLGGGRGRVANHGGDRRRAGFLGDQPLVRLDVVEALVAGVRQGRGPIIRPRHTKQRPDTPGHPELLAGPSGPRARQLEGDRGFSVLQSADPRRLLRSNVKGDNPDVDTWGGSRMPSGDSPPMKLGEDPPTVDVVSHHPGRTFARRVTSE